MLSKASLKKITTVNSIFGLFMVLLAGVAWAGGKADSQLPESGFERAKAGVFPALVRIYVVVENPFNGRMQKAKSSGSGAIISADGYVVTNHHVAGNGSHFVVNLSTQEDVRADLIGTDPLSDIAVLKLRMTDLKNPNRKLPVAKWGDSDKVNVGDVVYAMGSPGGLSQSITKGIISNTNLITPRSNTQDLKLEGENVGELVSWFAHDAVIFGGNSGGPLVDEQGDVVGINEITLANLGGAIPSNLARHSAQQIIEHGEVPRSWFGFELQPRLKSQRNRTGVLVSSIHPGSPAEKAGFLSGDVLTHFDGREIDAEIPEHMPDINKMLYHSPIGKKVSIKYRRSGKRKKATIQSVARERASYPQTEFELWGMTASNLPRQTAVTSNDGDSSGVLVGSVNIAGAVAKAKPPIKSGDIITSIDAQDINNTEDLIAQSQSLVASDVNTPVLVAFKREGQEVLSVVTVGHSKNTVPARSLRKGWLPVKTQAVAPELSALIGLDGKAGIRITRVDSTSLVELKTGDVITAVEGEPIPINSASNGSELFSLLRKYRAGRSVNLSVSRGGKEQVIAVSLVKSPQPKQELPLYDDKIFQLAARVSSEDKSVTIDEIVTGGWADINGVKIGDVLLAVNEQEIEGLASLEKMMKKVSMEKPRYIVFKVRRGTDEKFIELEPHW